MYIDRLTPFVSLELFALRFSLFTFYFLMSSTMILSAISKNTIFGLAF